MEQGRYQLGLSFGLRNSPETSVDPGEKQEAE